MRYIINKEKVLKDFKTITAFREKFNVDSSFITRKLGGRSVERVPKEYLIELKTVYIPNLEVVNHRSKADFVLINTNEGLRLEEIKKL